MSPAAKRGRPTSVLSTINWRFSPATCLLADEGQLWAHLRRSAALRPRSCASASHCGLERPRRGRNVLLIDQRRHELRTVEPNHALLVVAVRPQGVEGVVGTHGDVG